MNSKVISVCGPNSGITISDRGFEGFHAVFPDQGTGGTFVAAEDVENIDIERERPAGKHGGDYDGVGHHQGQKGAVLNRTLERFKQVDLFLALDGFPLPGE